MNWYHNSCRIWNWPFPEFVKRLSIQWVGKARSSCFIMGPKLLLSAEVDLWDILLSILLSYLISLFSYLPDQSMFPHHCPLMHPIPSLIHIGLNHLTISTFYRRGALLIGRFFFFFLDTTRQLHGSSCCLWILQRVWICGYSTFGTLQSRPLFRSAPNYRCAHTFYHWFYLRSLLFAFFKKRKLH